MYLSILRSTMPGICSENPEDRPRRYLKRPPTMQRYGRTLARNVQILMNGHIASPKRRDQRNIGIIYRQDQCGHTRAIPFNKPTLYVEIAFAIKFVCTANEGARRVGRGPKVKGRRGKGRSTKGATTAEDFRSRRSKVLCFRSRT